MARYEPDPMRAIEEAEAAAKGAHGQDLSAQKEASATIMQDAEAREKGTAAWLKRAPSTSGQAARQD
jgi:hypothetical protein